MLFFRQSTWPSKNFLAIFSILFAQYVFADAHPCKNHIETFCKGIEKGEGRIDACLKQHENSLSEECKQKRAQRKENAKARVSSIRESCKSDREKLCKGIKPGGGAIIKCLQENVASLSPSCKEAIARK